MKVLVADPIAQDGIDIMSRIAEVDVKTKLGEDQLVEIIGDYDAMVVRSQTQVTANIINAGKKLVIIGRAGVGVDNIDVNAATECGIIVANAPTGNTVSAAEHAIALMLSLARHIPQANYSLKSGQWKRADFMGTEVKNKTLGIIGLGNIGREVARRAKGLEMKILAYDPFVSEERAGQLQTEMVSLETLYRESDFITLHTPLTDTTRNMIDTQQLETMKPTTRIINAARGGLINEEALVKALNEGKLAGAAIDVFCKEPCTQSILFSCDKIIVTPHLGASTAEAQVLAATEVCHQIVDVLGGQPARYAVNAPFVSAEAMSVLGPYMKVAKIVGQLTSYLGEGNLRKIKIKYNGEISSYNTNALKASILGGLLDRLSEERVNMVNANSIASRRGIQVIEEKENTCENFANLITLDVETSQGNISVAGTVLRGEPHIVKVDQFWIDIVPTGRYFLFSDHRDRPGLIGAVGQITGEADVNVSHMYLSREKPRGRALMIMALDEPLTDEYLQKISKVPDVHNVKLVQL
ncbi:MAG: phosphoglycerate dehydrogenase [Dehalococcoidales bacterium]|jgi:D-3-phosphoglycerate dehydrogenase|nr:phosphoglycerate dehydrogenase [Dehalococcoidales bacterium]MDD4230169.1 phosphoglycerate dehydrogenase [Dehalococcoidales bacterium]MDD4465330.1 phosphoglycerate dehydrogenase [Dehalococcoidales bacterium]MDD5401974.1 phosphoglycerate dehydrogenase [Dehalococcoidales bacterium]